MNMKLSCRIFSGKHKAEGTNWFWDRAISSQNLPQQHTSFSKSSHSPNLTAYWDEMHEPMDNISHPCHHTPLPISHRLVVVS
ncbi:hypothetical protein I79_015261 [Cricetulus griseus]|uniref:Uncharacterized protein n=1 Tax=Cricetulus griseus TaxID=10029 RepID=G3HWA8_CRIGR|nr:hypothetical protein I79_015261 [Cricetulus griseus]